MLLQLSGSQRNGVDILLHSQLSARKFMQHPCAGLRYRLEHTRMIIERNTQMLGSTVECRCRLAHRVTQAHTYAFNSFSKTFSGEAHRRI